VLNHLVLLLLLFFFFSMLFCFFLGFSSSMGRRLGVGGIRGTEWNGRTGGMGLSFAFLYGFPMDAALDKT
jgi:hypothetical protein